MKIWSVANQKGGVGKTTTAVTLAGVSAMHGKRTLLLDLDPHGSLTAYFRFDPDLLQASTYNLFQTESPNKASILSTICDTNIENLSLIPASTALATLDRQLGAKSGMGVVIARALSFLEEDYDHVLIDCPPMLGVLMVNALAACQQLVIPVQTEFLAIKGLERMRHTLNMIQKARKLDIPYTIVPTMFDRRTRASVDSLRVLREKFEKHLWDAVIPIDTLFREASRAGKPLTHVIPDSRGAKAYENLMETLLGNKAILKQALA